MEKVDLYSTAEALHKQGFLNVCGVDEVGRGPLAGPVTVAAVIAPCGYTLDGVNDSKKISPKKREALYSRLVEDLRYKTVFVPAAIVDSIGIARAIYSAMTEAANALGPDIVLVDGNCAPVFAAPAKAIVGGDGKVFEIAAASIIAKVERDRYMTRLGEKYPQYLFEKHKGYGTAEHFRRIREYGLCPEHRRSFLTKLAEEL